MPDADIAHIIGADIVEAMGHVADEIERVARCQVIDCVAYRGAHHALLNQQEASYDLVSAQFLHLPKAPREALFRRLTASVAPGGSLLIVGHHPSDLAVIPRPWLPDLFFTADDVAALLDPQEWDIVVSEARGRGATDPEGRAVTIHDAVLRARRRG
jgi:hypothetical protein